MANIDTPNLIIMSFEQKKQISRILNFMQYSNRAYMLDHDKLHIGFFEHDFWFVSKRFKIEKMHKYFNLIIDDRFQI